MEERSWNDHGIHAGTAEGLVSGVSSEVSGDGGQTINRKGDRETTQLLRIATGCGTSRELVSEAQDSRVGSLF